MEREFSLGPWRVEPRLNKISRDGEVSHLEPRVMQTLCCLASAPDGIVSREELLQRVWQDAFVTEDALNRAISQLRKMLGDRARDPRYIETVPKVGYRLLVVPGEVLAKSEFVRSAEPAIGEPIAADSPVAEKTSIAVPSASHGWSRSVLAIALLLLLSIVGLVAMRAMLPLAPEMSAETSASEVPPRPPVAGATPLTTAIGPELYPALSPDGGRIAYVRLTPAGRPVLRVEVVGGSSGLDFGAEDPSDGSFAAAHVSPTWSPDGREIAWVRLGAACEVVISEAMGGPVRPLADCPGGRIGEVHWSPDGRWILAAPEPRSDTADGLWLLPVASGDAIRLTTGADSRGSFSPDGRAIAFVRNVAFATDELHVLDLGSALDSISGSFGSKLDHELLPPARRLTHDRRRVHGTAWSDDGRWILFTSDRGGEFALWRVALAGGSPQALGLTAPRLGRLSTGGDHLAVERWDVGASIQRVQLGNSVSSSDESASGSLLEDVGVGSTLLEWNATYSPDGRHFVFVSTRTGNAELWLAESESSVRPPRQLTRLGRFVQAPAWSPDGNRIAFETVTDDGADVFVVDLEGRPAQLLVASDAQERSPTWSQDGQWLYFASDRSGEWQIWRRPLASTTPDDVGQDQQITTEGGFFGIESPDGQWLFHSRRTEPGIWRQSIDGGASVRVTSDLRPSDWLSWHLEGSNVVLARRPQGLEGLGLEVVRLDPQTGAEEILWRIEQQNFETGLSVSPDGSEALLTLLNRVEVDLLLVSGVL